MNSNLVKIRNSVLGRFIINSKPFNNPSKGQKTNTKVEVVNSIVTIEDSQLSSGSYQQPLLSVTNSSNVTIRNSHFLYNMCERELISVDQQSILTVTGSFFIGNTWEGSIFGYLSPVIKVQQKSQLILKGSVFTNNTLSGFEANNACNVVVRDSVFSFNNAYKGAAGST